ncbi:hypothetical protein ACVWZK_006384 [Bradyrhizobium sp. GM0.4]
MSKEITIHSYPHGGIKGRRPRVPMVHLLAADGYGDVQSITFHPDDAGRVAAAIIDAAKSAAAGHGRKPIKIEFKQHE